MYILFFIISFSASIIGAICGIGGGIIIKPVMDAFGVLDVSIINFFIWMYRFIYDYLFRL